MSREEVEQTSRSAESGAGETAKEAAADNGLPGVGDRLRQYEIGAEVGRGGMGVVLRAHDLNLSRDVALKTLLPSLAGDQHARRRFIREARASSRLSHPNIVPVFEAFEENDRPWLVMPFIEGSSLRSMLADSRRLEPDVVIRLGEDLATALQAAHRNQIVHRDLTPGNVLVTPEGQALLVDFGLARFLPSPDKDQASMISTLTASGAAIGTPGFMSPEQVMGKKVDGRSDIFSLGTLLYKACTGHAPFAKGGFAQVFGAILHLDPEPVSRFTREVPEELERIIRKAMAKRPDERYQGADGMLADLRALRRRHESVSGRLTATSDTGRSWLSRVVVGIGIVAISGIAVLAGLRMRASAKVVEGVPYRLTSASGWENQPAISPDGSTVAYVSNESGNSDIWVVDARGGRQLLITNHLADDTEPTWFPDSSVIAFTSDRDGEVGVWTIGRLGGDPILVMPNAASPAISPDGRLIAFCRRTNNDTRVFVAPLDEPGQAYRLTGTEQGVWSHTNPAWSPDGTFICFNDRNSLWQIEVASRRATRLTDDQGMDRQPTYSADGRSVFFSSRRNGTRAIWKVPSEGGDPEPVTLGTGPEVDPHSSRDGSFLAYTTYHRQHDIVLADLFTGEQRQFGDLSIDRMPGFSPDQSVVVFSSDRWANQSDLWLQPLVDARPVGEPRRLTDQSGSESLPVFSPDGRWIAFHCQDGIRRDVEIVSVTGGRSVSFTTDPASDINPDWSPDGTLIVFASERDGTNHLYVAPVVEGRRGPGELRRLTDGPAVDFLPRWSPDGRSIAFMRSDDQGIDAWLVAASGVGGSRRLTNGVEVQFLAWDEHSGQLVVSALWGDLTESLRRVDPASGDTVPFGTTSQLAGVVVMDLSPDGRILAYDQEILAGDIWLLKGPEGTF